MKKIIEELCPPLILVIGFIIIIPPKPEPICPVCGDLFNILFSKVTAVIYIAIGIIGTFSVYQNRKQIK